MNLVSRPETAKLEEINLVWGIFWRGLVYGSIDGLLLTVFPWIVTWRALKADEKTVPNKNAVGLFVWVMIIIMTTSYHLGTKVSVLLKLYKQT